MRFNSRIIEKRKKSISCKIINSNYSKALSFMSLLKIYASLSGICFLIPSVSLFGQQNKQVDDFTSSNLPIIVINTNGQTIVDEPKITATMGVINNGQGNTNNITDSFTDYNGLIGIELRGNSTQTLFPKKPYLIETRDSLGENLDVSLLGMPRDEPTPKL